LQGKQNVVVKAIGGSGERGLGGEKMYTKRSPIRNQLGRKQNQKRTEPKEPGVPIRVSSRGGNTKKKRKSKDEATWGQPKSSKQEREIAGKVKNGKETTKPK